LHHYISFSSHDAGQLLLVPHRWTIHAPTDKLPADGWATEWDYYTVFYKNTCLYKTDPLNPINESIRTKSDPRVLKELGGLEAVRNVELPH
jgi:hypothetical protein